MFVQLMILLLLLLSCVCVCVFHPPTTATAVVYFHGVSTRKKLESAAVVPEAAHCARLGGGLSRVRCARCLIFGGRI